MALRPEDKVDIRVSASPSDLEAARRLAPPVKDAIADVVVRPPINFESKGVRAAVAQDRPRLLAELETVVRSAEAEPNNRARSALILVGLESRRGLDLLIDLLRAGAPDVRLAVLTAYTLERYATDPALRDAITACFEDADERVREAAVELGEKLGLRGEPSLETVAFLHRRILESDDYRALASLSRLLDRPASTISARSRAVLREYIETKPKGRLWSSAVDSIASKPSPEDEILLRRLVVDSPDPYRAGIALAGLARLLGSEVIPLIVPFVSHERLAPAAVEALGIAGSGTDRQDLVDAMLSAPVDLRGPSHLVPALQRIGGTAAQRGLLGYLRKYGDWPLTRVSTMDAVWSLRQIDPAQALARLSVLGILDRGVVESSRGSLTDGLTGRPYAAVFRAVVSSRGAVVYDAEASRVPCGHDSLVPAFAEAAAGRVRPECAREEYDAATHAYTLTFVQGPRVYTSRFRNEGDFYHPRAVADVVNRALRDGGLSEQFFPLMTSDQMAAWLLAPPDAAQQAAEELLLLFDRDQPLKRAVAQLLK